MFAWILNTNAEKPGWNGSTTPSAVVRGSGGIVMCRKFSRNGSTPKFVSAEPKNTGLRRPARTSSRSKE